MTEMIEMTEMIYKYNWNKWQDEYHDPIDLSSSSQDTMDLYDC